MPSRCSPEPDGTAAPSGAGPDGVKRVKRQLTPVQRQAWTALGRGSARLLATLEADLFALHGLRLDDYDILMHLHTAAPPGLRLGDLANRMLYSRPRLTHRLSQLITAGLVTRQPCADDGRGGLAVLTDTGRARLEAAAATKLDGLRRHLFAALDENDVHDLARIMTKIRNGLGDTYTSPD